MTIDLTPIKGLYIINTKPFVDIRGSFTKSFHEDVFKELGLNTDWKEEYFSTSKKNVIRGMHFFTPPEDHFKLVTCISGAVVDVVCDLRKESPSFKKVFSIQLNGEESKQVYIPKGCAHGFASLKENSRMFYKVSTVYNSNNDQGIHWDSIVFDWGIKKPIISERDSNFISLSLFNSPF
jgi:dTDP-4-dehydrorhamnose 3,5-epimerase